MYIDESGDTATLEQQGSRMLVLSGCVIHENDKREIEVGFRELKRRYYENPDIEIKSNFLRYANPRIIDSKKTSPIKLYDQDQYNALQSEIQKFLKSIPIFLIASVIDKKGYWTKYPSQNPYSIAYIFLLERFEEFLESQNELGLCIIDPREGRVVDKKNIDKDLSDTHNLLQWEKGGFWKPCPRIIEKVLFSDSSSTVGIQIADLLCYPIYHVFEYDKISTEYDWFNNISLPKLQSFSKSEPNSSDKKINFLKFFPLDTKKDFRFYNQEVRF